MTTFYPQNSLAREVIQVYNSLTWFLTKMIQKVIPEKYPPSLSPSIPFPLSPLTGNHFDLSLVYLSGFLVSADTHTKRKYIFLFSLKGDSIIHTPLPHKECKVWRRWLSLPLDWSLAGQESTYSQGHCWLYEGQESEGQESRHPTKSDPSFWIKGPWLS